MKKIDNIRKRTKSDHQRDIEYTQKHSPDIKNCIKVKVNQKTTVYFKKETTWDKIQDFIDRLNTKMCKYG